MCRIACRACRKVSIHRLFRGWFESLPLRSLAVSAAVSSQPVRLANGAEVACDEASGTPVVDGCDIEQDAFVECLNG